MRKTDIRLACSKFTGVVVAAVVLIVDVVVVTGVVCSGNEVVKSKLFIPQKL